MGKLLKGDSIVVGDWVSLDQQVDEYHIVEVEERTSEVFRMLPRERKKKVSAANVDYFLIVSSVSLPAFKRGIIDRFLVRAEQWGIKPIVIFNKMDEWNPEEVDLEFEVKRLNFIDVDSFFISSKGISFEQLPYMEKGIDQLKIFLANKTTVFLGQSGVGKSTLITNLSEGEVELKSLEVGKVGKGKHTTTWTELVELPRFSLIDSPGVRSFSLDDIDADELIHLVPDIEEVSLECKFNSCKHLPDNKGCRFFNNDWNNEKTEIIHSRLESFLRIQEELEQNKEY